MQSATAMAAAAAQQIMDEAAPYVAAYDSAYRQLNTAMRDLNKAAMQHLDRFNRAKTYGNAGYGHVGDLKKVTEVVQDQTKFLNSSGD